MPPRRKVAVSPILDIGSVRRRDTNGLGYVPIVFLSRTSCNLYASLFAGTAVVPELIWLT
jgi:hypothetical protein